MKYRRRRMYRWVGYITDVGRRSMWVHLEPDGHTGPDLEVEMDRRYLRGAYVGQLIRLRIKQKGVMQDASPPPLTAEQIAAANQWAERMAAELAEVIS